MLQERLRSLTPTLLTAENGNGGHPAAQTGFLAVPPPHNLEETGLRPALLEELALKTIYHHGRPTGRDVAETLALPFPVVHPVLDALRREELCEIAGSRSANEAFFEYVLTNKGREKVTELQSRRQYFGPAPVPFEQYQAMLQRLREARPVVQRETLQAGFGGLVVPDRLLGILGPALNSGEPILFYGPSGNGKTVLAIALGNVWSGQAPILLPRVVEAGGQLVQVYDPAIHELAEEEEPSALFPGLIRRPSYGPRDQRWVLIKRPVVVAGGELTMSKFDLAYEATANIYYAPYQMKANGGTLLIDDLGRQVMRPQDILNRLMIPLEEHKDYLAMATGQSLELPLDLMLIFSTNLRPSDLLDEAYLRRLSYRIPLANPSLQQFQRIFLNECSNAQIEYDPEMVDYLTQVWYEGRGIEMRACHPRDLIAHVLDICRFENLSPRLSRPLMDQACSIYFTGHPRADGAP